MKPLVNLTTCCIRQTIRATWDRSATGTTDQGTTDQV